MTINPITDPHALASQLAEKNFIHGEFTPAQSGETFDVINPATMEVIAKVPASDAADVDAAVKSAKEAQKAWANMRARDRGRMIAECGRLLELHVEELGRLTALETGKAIRTESRVEASVLADVFHFYGGLGSELKGETIPFDPKMLTMTIRQPIGVVGCSDRRRSDARHLRQYRRRHAKQYIPGVRCGPGYAVAGSRWGCGCRARDDHGSRGGIG